MHERAHPIATILAWNFIGAVAAVLFNATFHPGAPLHVLHSVVYANVIGTLVIVSVRALTPRLSRLPFPTDWALVTAVALTLSLAGTAIAAVVLIAVGEFPPNLAWSSPQRMGLGLLLGVIFGGSLYGYEAIRLRLEVTTMQHLSAQQLATQASLSSLESRIRPHFLFNTLNSISSLIHDDPAAAERTIERLAALLRFSLDAADGGTIPLEQELRIASDYLDIEKTRFGARLCYAVEVPDELRAVRVPPFLVQTLVENSVKYAIASQRRGGAIRIVATLEGGRVTVSVHDDGSGFTEAAIVPGHGLDNLRSRMRALFGSEAHVRVARVAGETIVSATFPVTA
jgi:two-component system sensor histidine kinase AlgZ